MPKLLSGIKVRDEVILELKKKFEANSATGSAAELAIIQVGNRADSTLYIQAKTNFAKKIGVVVRLIHLQDSALQKITQEQVISEIGKCNKDSSIKGIIVQLPLPDGFDKEKIIDTIDPKKDSDGLTSVNKKLLLEGNSMAIVPATARGVMRLLKYYQIDLVGKKITVVGRSELVGKPIAILCKKAGAILTVAHSKTTDLAAETKNADIIIVAVGKKNLIRTEHVSPGQTIIDIGISRDGIVGESNKKIVGDVDFEAVSGVIGSTGAITPVPGGVGPMTVLALFENLADACK